jgi:GNAT superfamily N-acetyltransferase
VTGSTEHRIGLEHLEGCVALSDAAGWNQNAADWRLMLELGHGWGYSAHGELIASTLVLPFGTFAWISMVLVLPAHRRKGYATRLLRIALDDLKRRSLTPVLDATPAGREVYRQEGFRDCWGFKRMVLPRRRRSDAFVGVRELRATDWPWMLELDRAAFGGDRERLLRSLSARLPAAAFVAEREGFVLARDGRGAVQMGPLVARSERVAQELYDAALSALEVPVYLDVADHAPLDREMLSVQRPFTRMVHGLAAAPGNEKLVYCVAGPELG